jgi:hypothetical protein
MTLATHMVNSRKFTDIRTSSEQQIYAKTGCLISCNRTSYEVFQTALRVDYTRKNSV